MRASSRLLRLRAGDGGGERECNDHRDGGLVLRDYGVRLLDLTGDLAAVLRKTELGEEVVELRRVLGR